MITSDDPLTAKLIKLLNRAHDIIWLNALEPIYKEEVLSQAEIEAFLMEVEEVIYKPNPKAPVV